MESVRRWLVAAAVWVARVLRGGWSWARHLIGAHRLQIRKYRAVALVARFGPLILRGAAIGGAVAGLHELAVKMMADSFLGHSADRVFQLNAEVVLTYVGTLLIAVFIEPIAKALDEMAESAWRRRDPPDDVLLDALERVRLSGARLAQVDQRWSAWPPSEHSEAPLDEFPTWPGVSTERTRAEIADAIRDLHESTSGAQSLAQQLGSNFGRLTNLASLDLVIDLSPSESTDPEGLDHRVSEVEKGERGG